MNETGASASSSVEADVSDLRTFLIADVRGYTLFTQQRGDEVAAKLARKFAAIAREGVDARGGHVIELRGDEALAVFSSARQAIRAAVDLQQRFVEGTMDDPSLPLPVGIGLDIGEAVRVEGGYRGGALNLAARLCGEAAAGEVLASREVVHLARKIDGVRYVDRGELHLKGLPEPVRAVKVVPDSGDPSEVMSRFAPARPATVPPLRRTAFLRGLVSSRPRLVATVVVLALVAAGIPLALTTLGGGTPAVAIGENAVGLMDAESGRVVGSIHLAAQPGAIASGEGAVWVATTAGSVVRIDPRERRVTQTIPVGQDPTGIAVGEGAVWVTNAQDGTVSRINPATNTVVKTIEVGNGPEGVAVGHGAVWVANTLDDTVAGIDPGTDQVSGTIAVSGSPSGIAFGAGALWITNDTEATVSRIDPASGAVTATTAVGNGPSHVAAGPDGVWVTNRLDGTVSKIDPDTNAVAATFPTGDQTAGIAIGPDAVWVASELGTSVTRLDLSGGPARTIDVHVAVLGVALVNGTLWFTSHGAPTSHRGGTITAVATADSGSIDPAIGTAIGPPLEIASLVGDGLVGFKRVGGVDGSTLVPDLAVSIPRPTDGGTTYAFQLRPGIPYSDGRTVRASDFRRAIERDFKVGSPAASEFGNLRGADACARAPASCDLSGGIVTDDRQGTITFHLTAPDPDLLYSLALPEGFPVPPGVPDNDVGTKPVPATGPYMITRYVPNHLLELGRNPRFKEWTGNRPDGFVDRIVVRLGVAPEDLANEVLKGQADYVVNPPLIPPDQMNRLLTQDAQLVHTYTRWGTFFFFLNTRLPPFDDARVRRAVNFAVDRKRVLDLFPLPASKITCQILPGDFPGYRPYCPYTVDPNGSGTWTAPDLDRARQLIRASGTAGTKITVQESPAFAAIGRYFTSLLNDLGYRARLHISPDPMKFFGFVLDSRNDVQTAGFSFLNSIASANQFLKSMTCKGFVLGNGALNQNPSEFCDPAIDRLVERAQQVQISDPTAAGPLWAAVDRAAVDEAPWVALVTPGWVDVVSKRLGNYEANPASGMLLDQEWVR